MAETGRRIAPASFRWLVAFLARAVAPARGRESEPAARAAFDFVGQTGQPTPGGTGHDSRRKRQEKTMTSEYVIYWTGPGALPWYEWLTPDVAASRAAELDALYPGNSPHAVFPA
jgi:hypothetical protein